MTKIYRYKMIVDIGMAPCIDDGLVTLATCKPGIRAQSRPGDWVIGFRSLAKGAPAGSIIWAGRVAQSFQVGDYERRHRGRSDAVYRELSDGTFKRLRLDYHPGMQEFLKDTSSPVLVFDPGATWYFGGNPRLLPDHLMHLAPKLRDRNFLVNGAQPEDTAKLEKWLQNDRKPGIQTGPREGPTSTIFCCSPIGRPIEKINQVRRRC